MNDPQRPTRAGRNPFWFACLGALMYACAQDLPSVDSPNIVFIMADDLGWADVGFQGSTFHCTENIDALAERGLVFSNSYSSSPECSPSRASILTGMSPARLQLTQVIQRKGETRPVGTATSGPADRPLWSPVTTNRLPEGAATIASCLQDAGYRTAMIGKWHLDDRPTQSGFQVHKGTVRLGKLTNYTPPYFIRTLPDGPVGEYMTDRLTDEAITFIEENRADPFFLYLAHFAPHSPFVAKPHLIRRYEARVDPKARQHNPVYAAMIKSLDESVGRIVETLERLGLMEKTIVVFTSDNGGFEGPHARDGQPAYHVTSNWPLRSGKGRLYEGGVRVPTIIAGHGVSRPGETCDVPIIGMDFLPTFCALAGVAPPEGTLDGEDISSLLAGSAELDRDALFFHFPHQSFASSIRRGNKKLIHFYLTDRDELYDLEADVGEQNDLAAVEPELVTELRQALKRWLRRSGASLPVRNPRYERGNASKD